MSERGGREIAIADQSRRCREAGPIHSKAGTHLDGPRLVVDGFLMPFRHELACSRRRNIRRLERVTRG
jgi:hypothetical protein